MFLATTNKTRRLLYLSYIGRVTAEEVERGREEVNALVGDWPDGFRVLADFSRLESMDVATTKELGRLMDVSSQRGVQLVVRVLPDPRKDPGLNILARFHYKHPVQLVTCDTMEEAVRALEI
jgi:anti-anti-sigma regulatory factor